MRRWRQLAWHTVGGSADATEERQPTQQRMQQTTRTGGACQGDEHCAVPAPPPQRKRRWQQDGQPLTASAAESGPQPAANRQQRRKQAQPQHLPSQQEPQQEAKLEPSLAATVHMLVEGPVEADRSEGPAANRLSSACAAVRQAAGTDAAAQLAEQPQQQPLPVQAAAAAAEPDVFKLLQQATHVAAAAASGLTPELVASFASLPPMDARRVSGSLGAPALKIICLHSTDFDPCGWALAV